MMNELFIESVKIQNNTITCSYNVKGAWEQYFSKQRTSFITYSADVSSVPKSVAVLPFICNVLPMVWLCDAILHVESLDEDFCSYMDKIRQGYQSMYPMLDFKGTIETKTEKNVPVGCRYGAAAFFSGGVDAYTTLLRHLEEKPVLVTIWGADIKLTDEIGWKNVSSHTTMAAGQFGLESLLVKSDFRSVVEGKALSELVRNSGDGWWHGFQHGISIISHIAPIAYTYGIKTVYIASSHPERMKGTYTCASDPTIDNYVHFCGCTTVHDGCELDRQGKVNYLVARIKELDIDVKLRVCWEVSGGGNCCHCEKCYRTILEIVSEGGNPNEYGFVWGDKEIKRCKRDMKTKIYIPQYFINQYYFPIQEMLEKNKKIISDIQKYQWLQEIDFSKFNNGLMKKGRRFISRWIRAAIRIIRR